MWDGMSNLEELVKRTKELGQPAIAATDHGNMSAFPDFYKIAKKEGIVPLIGQEMYVIDDTSFHPKKDDKFKDGTRKRGYYHMVLIAKDEKGYETLVKLTSLANTPENYYYKGRIDFKILESMKDDLNHLIATTGCEIGFVPNAIMRDKPKRAKKYLEYMRYLFPNLYVEIMKHPGEREEQKDALNRELVHLARRYDLPLLITNDIHYVRESQQGSHRMLVVSGSKGNDKNPDSDLFAGTGYHLKSEDEMREMFPDKWFARSESAQSHIWSQVQNFHVPLLDEKKWYIPKFQRKNADEIDSLTLIRSMCIKRMKKLGLYTKKYRRRLKKELEVIHRAKFEEEFLIVRDYIRYARRNGILVGAGRGSMAGVLVAFLLRITDVDPIRYDLLFERALNPARPSLPDFDVDFQAKRRDEIIAYITDKWGAENVMQVCTFNAMAPKGAVRAVLRGLDVPYPVMVQATKALPDTVEIIGERKKAELKDILEDEDFLIKEAPELNKLMHTFPKLKRHAINLQGTIQGYGTHAAGVIVSDGKQRLKDFIPTTYLPGPKRIVSQYDMAGLKSFGFVKFDILGLNTLDTIADAVAYIGHDPFKGMTEFEDQDTFDMLNAGSLSTVFQLQGYSCRACIKVMGIKSFEDIVAVNALSRPGATKFLNDYHEQRDHPHKIKYIHPKLKPILEKSNGVLLYQEQTMQIALDIAGWDHHITDDLKEAIKYKKSDIFKTLHPKFIAGCLQNGVKKSVATALWDLIRDASGYQFNRAHSVSYAMLGYQTAYLKRHYPAPWYAAYLANTDTKSPESKGKLNEIMTEARAMGVKFLPPDINKSNASFKAIGRKKIRFGLSEVKGVGLGTASAIVLAREDGYNTMEDIEQKLQRRYFNSRVRLSLFEAGALDSLRENGSPKRETVRGQSVGGGSSKSARQLEYLGVVLDFHIPKRYRRKIAEYLENPENKANLESGEDAPVIVGGIATHVQKHVTKKGDLMARVRVDHYTGSWELAVFPKTYERLGAKLVTGAVIIAAGTYQKNWNSIAVNQIQRLDNFKDEKTQV